MQNYSLTRRHLVGSGAVIAGAIAAAGIWQHGVAEDATPIPNGTPEPGTPVATPAPTEELLPVQIEPWSFYGHDISGTRFTDTSNITSDLVSELQLAWTATVDGPISSTPVTGEGLVVIGSYDGKLRALDPASGNAIWTVDTGAAVPEPNLKIPLGITGSAAIADGVVYTGDATGKLWAIDAATGDVRWTAEPDAQHAASIWSSPVVADGVLYVGIASVAKETGFRGAVVAVDAQTGELRWKTAVTPEGSDGGGVFAVPALDTQRGILYVGTQNAYSPTVSPESHVLSILALKMDTGELVWAFSGLTDESSATAADDIGFSASPNLFSIRTESGETRDLVGNGQKSGIYWALDRDTGEVVWSTRISPSGPLGGMEGTSAVGNGIIVVPATEWESFDNPKAKGVVRGLHAATGEVIWTYESDAPNPAPVAIANDVAFQAGFDGLLHAFDLNSGTELWNYDLGASVSGGVSVAGDLVIVGAATPAFAPFIKPGTSVFAFQLLFTAPAPDTPTPEPAPETATPEPAPDTPTAEASPQASPVAD